MSQVVPRRPVDWRVIIDRDAPRPRPAESPSPVNPLATALSALGADPTPEAADGVLRAAVEFARQGLALNRAAIFLLDQGSSAMLGTWGTDAQGETADEHHIMYDLGGTDREVFERAAQGVPWVVFEDCPVVDQRPEETRVIGRGWVACTAIAGPGGPIGILFNDGWPSRTPVDEAKQARAVILCSLLGQALDGYRQLLTPAAAAPPAAKGRHPMVTRSLRLMGSDPALDVGELAVQLGVSAGRLARVFKQDMGISIVEHRNELKLARFLTLVDAKASNLLEAALSAGFGSYAQFHRVFRGRFGESPREYLSHRG